MGSDEEQQLYGTELHRGNENVRTRQELAIHVRVLTTYCDMANVMLGEVYLLKENELLTHEFK